MLISNFTYRSGAFYTFAAIAAASTKAACVFDRPVKRVRLLNTDLTLVDSEGHALSETDGDKIFEFPCIYGYPILIYLSTGADAVSEIPYVEVLEYGDHASETYFDCFNPIVYALRAKAGNATVLGKSVSDLQTNVSFDNIHGTVSGELKYVDDYTGYSEDEAEQVGNYVVIAIDTSETGVTYKALLGTDGVEKTFSANKDCVLRVSTAKQLLLITATKDGRPTVEKSFVTNFTLDEEA